MPTLYLSPSTQEWNPYVDGGTEEQYMNEIADAMEPWLRASGIAFTRNSPQMTAAGAIRQSNQGNYDLHLALHSNAAPASMAGQLRGGQVYYAQGSRQGRRAAEIFAAGLRSIYPGQVQVIPTTTLGEVTRTRAPAVLIEYAYHDNPQDAQWIRDNIQLIAENTARSVADYFGMPLIAPTTPQPGRVVTQGGNLRVRGKPSLTAPIVGALSNGQRVTVYGRWQGWCSVYSSGLTGWADCRYIHT